MSDKSQLSDLSLARQDIDQPVTWAVERTDLNASTVQPYWGPVDEAYANDTFLYTMQATSMYIPRSQMDVYGQGIAVYFMRNSEPSSTWSRFTASIQRSFWPNLLRTQSATSNEKLHKNIEGLAAAVLIGEALLTIAHIMTPLGLYTTTDYVSDGIWMDIHYIADTGLFGIGTADRSYYAETRTCDMTSNMLCPGQSWLNGVPNTVRRNCAFVRLFNRTMAWLRAFGYLAKTERMWLCKVQRLFYMCLLSFKLKR